MQELQEKEEEKELDLGSDEPDAPLSLTVTSRVKMKSLCSFFLLRSLKMSSFFSNLKLGCAKKMQVLYMLGDITAGPAYRFTQWLELVRKRSGKYRSSGFPNRPNRLDSMPSWYVI